MSTVTLTKWGNSAGVRIPAAIMKEAHLKLGEEIKIIINKKGNITLVPAGDPQEGWTEAFNAIADSENEELLLDITNDFDKDEWTW